MTGDIHTKYGDNHDNIYNLCDNYEYIENSGENDQIIKKSTKNLEKLKNKKSKNKVRFNDNTNQYNNQNHLEPTFLGYTEKQLLQFCHGNYNVKTLVKNDENLLAFNYALKDRTKVANKPVASSSGEAHLQ